MLIEKEPPNTGLHLTAPARGANAPLSQASRLFERVALAKFGAAGEAYRWAVLSSHHAVSLYPVNQHP